MNRVVLDTDISSRIIKRRIDHPTSSRLASSAWCVSFATAGELWRWAVARDWGAASRDNLDQRLDTVAVLHSDERTTRVWGEITGRARRRGRPPPDNDSWIAACCLAYGLPLATGNVKDYADFAEHDGLRLVLT